MPSRTEPGILAPPVTTSTMIGLHGKPRIFEHPLQHSLKDLDRAYQNFFAKRDDFPRFKKRGQHDSFRFPDPTQFKLDQGNSRIFLPKLGWLRYRNSRQVLGLSA